MSKIWNFDFERDCPSAVATTDSAKISVRVKSLCRLILICLSIRVISWIKF